METTQNNKEYSIIGAIVADHYIKSVYKIRPGYMNTLEVIADVSHKVFNTFQGFDWEEVLEDPTKFELPEDVCCWDDAIIWKAGELLEKELSTKIQIDEGEEEGKTRKGEYKIFVVWDRETIEQFEQGKKKREELDCKEFNTHAEAVAYREGVCDANGWDDPLTIFVSPETPSK